MRTEERPLSKQACFEGQRGLSAPANHGGGEAPVPGEVQGGRRGGGCPQRHD